MESRPGLESSAALTEAEERKILVEFNRTWANHRRDLCVHQLFEAQVERTPDATAVVYEEQRLTYRELNLRANRLAHYLRNGGAGPEVLVGICLERSPDMLIGILGILKAGAAYVPLDPAYPEDRLAVILEDSKAPLLLTQKSLLATLPQHAGQAVCMDTDWPAIAEEPAGNPQSGVKPGNLSYVLFTSGSTGRPKGVQVEHRNLVSFLAAMQVRPGITANDALLAVTTLCFDIAGLELYLPLISGAKVVLATREQAANGRQLRSLLDRSHPTVMQATPATWRMLLLADWQDRPKLKILCGGEAMPPSLAGELLPRCVELWNMYGPTETTIWSSVFRIESATHDSIPIGRPITNTTMYILDELQGPVPIGSPGELYIGGDGVARGYLGRPDLTAERFLPNPFNPEPGARMYRTGDLACFLPDGNIQYLGRMDSQVKIRGFRIELGEIESVLMRHSSVQSAVVVAREDRPGDRRLVAYVVPTSPAHISTPTLDAFVRRTLPEYMVPSAFVTMDSLPLTPNGKVDRKTLPLPSLSTTNNVTLRIRPRNSFEAQLTLIWEEILQIRPIGINDNFFALGGHSLLAAHMFVEIEKRFDRTLSPGTILAAPTIEMLASVLAQDRMCVLSRSLVPIRPTGSYPPFFCVHGRGGNVISLRDLAMNMSPDRPFYCLQARGLDGTEPLLTIEEMAAEYIREIKSAQPEGPYFIGGASFGGMVAFEMARQFESRGERVALLALLDTYNEAFGKSLPATSRVLYHVRYLFERSRLRLRESLPQEQKDSFYLFKVLSMLGRMLVNEVLGTTRKGNGTSDSLSTALDRIPKMNIEAAKNYFPQSYSGNITLFKAKTRVAEPYHDPFLGWGKVALGGLDVEEVPGTHTSCLREPDVRVLAQKLETKLRVAGAGDSNAVPWSRPYPR